MDDSLAKADPAAVGRAAAQAVAAHLKAERVRAGLLQEDLAALTGISAQTISKMELGQRKMGIEHVAILAEALGVSAGDFVDDAQAAMRKRLTKKNPRENG